MDQKRGLKFWDGVILTKTLSQTMSKNFHRTKSMLQMYHTFLSVPYLDNWHWQ